MAKRTVSHRLDEGLIAEADAYAVEHGSTRSVVLEEGLRQFLQLAKGGVPDLPQPVKPVAVRPQVKPMPTVLVDNEAMMRERQRRLNQKMGWS